MNASNAAMLFAGLLVLGLSGEAGVAEPDTWIVADGRVSDAATLVDSNETIAQYCTRCHSEQRQLTTVATDL